MLANARNQSRGSVIGRGVHDASRSVATERLPSVRRQATHHPNLGLPAQFARATAIKRAAASPRRSTVMTIDDRTDRATQFSAQRLRTRGTLVQGHAPKHARMQSAAPKHKRAYLNGTESKQTQIKNTCLPILSRVIMRRCTGRNLTNPYRV